MPLATMEGEILAIIEENRAQTTFRCSTIQHPLGPQQIFFFYSYSSRLFRICSNTLLAQFSKTVVQAPMEIRQKKGFFPRNSDRKGSRFSCVLISLSVLTSTMFSVGRDHRFCCESPSRTQATTYSATLLYISM